MSDESLKAWFSGNLDKLQESIERIVYKDLPKAHEEVNRLNKNLEDYQKWLEELKPKPAYYYEDYTVLVEEPRGLDKVERIFKDLASESKLGAAIKHIEDGQKYITNAYRDLVLDYLKLEAFAEAHNVNVHTKVPSAISDILNGDIANSGDVLEEFNRWKYTELEPFIKSLKEQE